MFLQGLKGKEDIWETSGLISLCAQYGAELSILH